MKNFRSILSTDSTTLDAVSIASVPGVCSMAGLLSWVAPGAGHCLVAHPTG